MSIRACLSVIFLASVIGCQAETFTSSGPTGLEVLHGPPPLVSLGTELDTLLLVRVVDEAGDPISGVEVNWQITVGDGELIPGAPLSGADGLASARWKFGMIPGPKRVQVSVAGLDPVTLSTEAVGFRAVQVTAGYTHACALDAGGIPWCWNADSIRRGAPGSYNNIRPTQVSGGHQFAEIRAGDDYTCGRTASGEVWCWGDAYSSAFGPGITTPQGTPIRITGLPTLRILRTGLGHSCGIATDSTTWCWGNNSVGQSGAGGTSVAPTQVSTALTFVDLALGSGQSCGLTAAGTAYCWGDNGVRQLGDSGATRTAPTTPVLGGHTFVELQAGDDNSCGRTSTGEVWCWGRELYTGTARFPSKLDLPAAWSLSISQDYIAVGTLGGRVAFAPFGPLPPYVLPVEIEVQGVQEIAGRGSFCLITRTGDVFCSGSIVDQASCSSISPYGCADTGPIPLPVGGRVYGYPPFGD